MDFARAAAAVDEGSLLGDLARVRDHLALVHSRAASRYEAGDGPMGSVELAARLLCEVDSLLPLPARLRNFPEDGAS